MRFSQTFVPAVLLLSSASISLPIDQKDIHLSDPAFLRKDDTYRDNAKGVVKTYLDDRVQDASAAYVINDIHPSSTDADPHYTVQAKNKDGDWVDGFRPGTMTPEEAQKQYKEKKARGKAEKAAKGSQGGQPAAQGGGRPNSPAGPANPPPTTPPAAQSKKAAKKAAKKEERKGKNQRPISPAPPGEKTPVHHVGPTGSPTDHQRQSMLNAVAATQGKSAAAPHPPKNPGEPSAGKRKSPEEKDAKQVAKGAGKKKT